jgi:ABC-type transport system involved in cytochrome c biogenesis ATPase subunit
VSRRLTVYFGELARSAGRPLAGQVFECLDRHGIGIVEELMAAHVANGGMLVMTSHHEVSLHRTAVHRLNLSA